MIAVGMGLSALAALAVICPRVRVGSPFHRALRRGVLALGLLTVFSLIPGIRVGVNGLTLLCVGTLGLPGLGLAQVIAAMP